MLKLMRAIFGIVMLTSVGVASLPAEAMPAFAPPAVTATESTDLVQQARTICRWDGSCFNTSGRPMYAPRRYYRPRYYAPRRRYIRRRYYY